MDGRRRGLLALLAAAATPLAASEARLPAIDDLRALARQVERERKPLLLFFSTPGCPYCLEARRGYLAPRLAESDGGGVLIREASVTGTRRFIGLDGQPQAERDLAARFGVRSVPDIRLVDAGLQPLAEPLIGLSQAFYEALLQQRIDEARRRLRG